MNACTLGEHMALSYFWIRIEIGRDVIFVIINLTLFLRFRRTLWAMRKKFSPLLGSRKHLIKTSYN